MGIAGCHSGYGLWYMYGLLCIPANASYDELTPESPRMLLFNLSISINVLT